MKILRYTGIVFLLSMNVLLSTEDLPEIPDINLPQELKDQLKTLPDLELIKDIVPNQDEILENLIEDEVELESRAEAKTDSEEYFRAKKNKILIKQAQEESDLRNLDTRGATIKVQNTKTKESIKKCKEGFSITEEIDKKLKVTLKREKKASYSQPVESSFTLPIAEDIPREWIDVDSGPYWWHLKIIESINLSALKKGLKKFLIKMGKATEKDKISFKSHSTTEGADTGWGQDDIYFIASLLINYEISKSLEEELVRDDPSADSWSKSAEEEFVLQNNCKEKKRQCLDSGTKNIEGSLEVTRDCWHWQITYECNESLFQDSCSDLRKSCDLQKSTCLEYIGDYCKIWEREFKCADVQDIKKIIKIDESNLNIDESQIPKVQQQKNNTIKDLVFLKVFGTLPENIDDSDLSFQQVTLFKGEEKSCDKHILACIDCCASGEGIGWAKEFGFVRCKYNEKILAKRRSANQCVFIGQYKAPQTIEWPKNTSKFCCFDSSFAKIIQEAARAQLGISWGSMKNPDCRGLTMEEFQQIDFSSVDLSGFFKDLPDKTKEQFEEDCSDLLRDFDVQKEEEKFQDKLKRKDGSF